MTVYTKYIKDGAPNEVNLSFEVRQKLREKSKTGNWMTNDFNEAKEEVMTSMVR
jgi:hypothetical protein